MSLRAPASCKKVRADASASLWSIARCLHQQKADLTSMLKAPKGSSWICWHRVSPVLAPCHETYAHTPSDMTRLSASTDTPGRRQLCIDTCCPINTVLGRSDPLNITWALLKIAANSEASSVSLASGATESALGGKPSQLYLQAVLQSSVKDQAITSREVARLWHTSVECCLGRP